MAGRHRPATENTGRMTEPTLCEGAVPHQRAGRLHDVPLPVPEGWRSVRTSTRRPWHPHEIRKRQVWNRRFQRQFCSPCSRGERVSFPEVADLPVVGGDGLM